VEIIMYRHESSGAHLASAAVAAAALLTGCVHHPPPKQFSATAPFSKTFSGSGDTVCWSVKRALLSQGYMLDRPTDSGVLTGSRDEQPKPKLNVTTRLQTTCADNRNGTSIVFVTAEREENTLQKMKQTTSMGVGPATLTMPAGSARVLGTVRRETIKDPDFYGQFFGLVQNYVDQERVSQAATRSAGDGSAGNADDKAGDADGKSTERPSRLSSDLPQRSTSTQSQPDELPPSRQ
jgi:Uncharacterized protein conserved in bacteria (DUF2242)